MKNFDIDELKKFSSYAHQWWDPHGCMAPLHAINPLRLEYITKQTDVNGKNIIDVGCGGGILTESLAQLGGICTGIDLNADLIQTAKLHLYESKLAINYSCTEVEEYANSHTQQFDIVTCMEMLEHVPDPAAIIKACAQLVKAGGQIFFSTINRNIKAYLFAIIGAEYTLNLLEKGTHDYNKFIKPSELNRWAEECALQLKHLMGMSYNPLNKKYFLTEDISVNYLAYFLKNN